MPLETAQMLCSVFHALSEKASIPYKKTHFNHPCSVWARHSNLNFCWLVEHGFALCEEYKLRYGREHKCREVIQWCHQNKSALQFELTNMTPFAQAMPEKHRGADAVEAYRSYYIEEKSQIAVWPKGRTPSWWPSEKSCAGIDSPPGGLNLVSDGGERVAPEVSK